ncbi:predicted protein [Lichtheimia corymbifera JMRC:FSU:9682]|uniref:Uncharacterized protein n=1 Tax=Lichtheimia corymbifera JMRC:FSU:9682 TaxID=1263082 RepID=A0A068SI82_9FUNG|nr:predicted protein [Lichtheimia corymbifera JMRC:FSU:9682]
MDDITECFDDWSFISISRLPWCCTTAFNSAALIYNHQDRYESTFLYVSIDLLSTALFVHKRINDSIPARDPNRFNQYHSFRGYPCQHTEQVHFDASYILDIYNEPILGRRHVLHEQGSEDEVTTQNWMAKVVKDHNSQGRGKF